MNKFIGIGRLTKKPEIRYTQNEIKIAIFTIAISNGSKKDEKNNADFINCIAFKNTADYIEKYIDKGNLIAIEGRIQSRKYEDKEGNKRYTTEIMVEKITFLQTNKKSETTQTATQETQQSDPYKDFGEIVENENLELPF